jgi:hypothetical protein
MGCVAPGEKKISYSTVNLFDIPYDSIDWYQTNARPVLTSTSVAGIKPVTWARTVETTWKLESPRPRVSVS